MKKISQLTIQLLLALFLLGTLSACGQKGPLVVERPVEIQEDDRDETR